VAVSNVYGFVDMLGQEVSNMPAVGDVPEQEVSNCLRLAMCQSRRLAIACGWRYARGID